MEKNYEIMKSLSYRAFTEAELASTANGTALIIDDADFGLMAIIPMKDKTYKEMWLSDAAFDKKPYSKVIELNKASILEICTAVVSNDPSIKSTRKVEIFLDF